MTVVAFLALILLSTSVLADDIYTNEEALMCFRQDAMEKCQTPFQECIDEIQCQKELHMFNVCSFGDTVEEGAQIFNGYCFRRWQDQAHLTQDVITCMTEACNLRYNSELGVKEMVRCTQWMIFDAKIDCDEPCQDQMETKVKERFNELPLKELYSQEFEDKQAQHLAKVLLKECVGQGRGHQMIMREEYAEEEKAQIEKNQTVNITGHEQFRYDQEQI